ncbi:uncharacterized protein [Branchiostoma lanceolatum]|uniref:uncharacterized protein n=1 Tax=Branchiostoma lanceolatum TaxID=7740 RepID=UPI003455E46E
MHPLWCSGQVAFVLYRILVALVTVTILMFLLCNYYITDGSSRWPVYLTNWCFSILTLHTIVAMSVSIATYSFAMAYGAFYVIYWATGGKGKNGEVVLYKLWDFENDPKMAIVYMVLLVFVATPFFHLLTYGLHRLKAVILAKTLGSDAGANSPLRRGQRDYKLYVETAL